MNACKELWGAFERLKSIYAAGQKEKKDSTNKIIESLAKNLDNSFFDDEFRKLTDVGNKHNIRHTEPYVKNLDELELEYLFFRMLALINLTLNRLSQKEENI